MTSANPDHVMISPSYHHDDEDDDHDDASYSDDFDGDFDPDLTVSEKGASCNPGEVDEIGQGNVGEARSTFVSGNIYSPVKKIGGNNGRQLRTPKVMSSAHSGTISESRVQSVELSRQYGLANLQDRLAQTMKRLRHEKKENNRLRDIIQQSQRAERSPEIENERADLKRQLKECKSEIKTLKTDLRRYETAQAEYQQSVSDYPERIRILTKEVRHWKEKCNERTSQIRDDERKIRTQHDKICSLQKQLQNHLRNARKGNVKSEIERERDALQCSEKEYRRQIADLKHIVQKEQRRNRRMSTTMKTMTEQFEGEIIRLGNLLREKDRKLSSSVQKLPIAGQREGAHSRNGSMRGLSLSTEGDHEIDQLSTRSDIAHELQTSLDQIKSAFPSESGCDPGDDDSQQIGSEFDGYEDDFDE